MKPSDVIEAYHSGDHINNDDLIAAIIFFEDLASKLHKCGPILKLAALEAANVARGCRDFAVARNLEV